MRFDFATANRIVFGNGSSAEIGNIIRSWGVNSVFLIEGTSGSVVGRIRNFLESMDIRVEAFAIHGEPDLATIMEGRRRITQSAFGAVVAVGGGSALDTGKALAALSTNPGDPLDYLETVGKGQALKNPSLPMAAIPTTSGTGSEVTRNAVVTVTDQKVKVSLRSPFMLPKVALVDPELTLSLPAQLTASTGMDALAQVLEPFVSIRANAMTDLYCRDGLKKVVRSLRTAYQHGENLVAREEMSFGSLMGGMALANAGLGAVHGFAAPIGGIFGGPHGAICARLLAPVVRVNIRALRQRQPDNPALLKYEEAASIITGSSIAKPEDSIVWLEQLCEDLQIPALSHYEISESDIPLIVEKSQKASSMQANPIRLTENELEEILLAAI